MFALLIWTACAVGRLRADDLSGAQNILRARSPQEALGLPIDASPEMIKNAHRQLAKEYFPKANLGDEMAKQVMQKLNGARDELTKTPLAADPGSVYDDRVGAGATADERARIRSDLAKQAAAAGDFAKIAAAGAAGAREAVAFAEANMSRFLMHSPSAADLQAFAATGQTAEGQQAIYRIALAKAYTPEQFLKLLAPAGGGAPNANLEAAVRAELPRFFGFGPNADQVQRLRMGLRNSYGAKGLEAFEQAAKGSYAYRPKTSVLNPGRGLMERVMGRFAQRALAVDPTLATGLAAEATGQAEAQALNEGTCPSSFVTSSGRLLTAEYRRTLAIKGREFADLVAYDCAQKSPALGQKLTKLLEDDRREGADKLKTGGQRVQCRAAAGAPGLSIDLTLANGQRATVRFDTPERPRSLEIRPQPGPGANPNYFLKADFGRETELSYCAYAPRTVTPDENLRIIKEPEASFLVRATCTEGSCDHVGFIENTEVSDSNIFSSAGPMPDETRPFGELDKAFVMDSARTYRSLISLIRGVPAERRNFAEVCRALGGEAPAVSHQWAAPTAPPRVKAEPASTAR